MSMVRLDLRTGTIFYETEIVVALRDKCDMCTYCIKYQGYQINVKYDSNHNNNESAERYKF